jgi:hypothetical protein
MRFRITRRNLMGQVAACCALLLALVACSGPSLDIPPTPTPNPSAMSMVSNHSHGESGPNARLITRYGGPVAVELSTQPEKPQPHTRFTITYSLKDTDGSGLAGDRLRLTHERLMHLIVVSQDLQHFAHIHPQDMGDGRYTVGASMEAAGKYLLFNEFVTADGTTQIERDLIATSGAEDADTPAALVPDVGQPQQVEGLTVTLTSAASKVRRRAPATFNLNVTRDGQPVTDLQPFLGAACHVVIVSADTKQFAHTHGDVPGGAMSGDMSGMNMGTMAMPTPPARFGPALQFTHTFMQPGLYRVWVQFGHKDKVVTVAYNVQVVK